MKRRNFTILSGLALPAAALPVNNLLSGFYARMSMQELQEPIAAHLKDFRQELTEGLKSHHQTSLANTMFQPTKITSLQFKNDKNYHFTYVNQAGNEVTLNKENGKRKTIVA